MKLINNGENNLLHVVDKDVSFLLEVGKVLDVPKEVAEIWLTYPGISTHVTIEDLEKEKEKAVQEALKTTNASKPEAKVQTKKKPSTK